jgi:hypothetical protein
MAYTRQWLRPLKLREYYVDWYVRDPRDAEHDLYWAVVDGAVRTRLEGRLLTSEEAYALRKKRWSDAEEYALPADLELSVADAKRFWGQPDDLSSKSLRPTPSKSLRPAPEAMIVKAIRSVYDAIVPGAKPPNIRELPVLVQPILIEQGFTASARSIQEIGGADEFKGRRRPPGPTLTSERRARRK